MPSRSMLQFRLRTVFAIFLAIGIGMAVIGWFMRRYALAETLILEVTESGARVECSEDKSWIATLLRKSRLVKNPRIVNWITFDEGADATRAIERFADARIPVQSIWLG